MHGPGLSNSESEDRRVLTGRDSLRDKSIEQRVSKLPPELRHPVTVTANLRRCISGSFGRQAWVCEERHARTPELNRYQKQKQLGFSVAWFALLPSVFPVERFVLVPPILREN